MEKVVKSSVQIEYKGDIWVGEWVSYILKSGKETPDHWLVISKNESGTLTDALESNFDATPAERKIRSLVIAERVREIQKEYGIPHDVHDIPADGIDEIAITSQILDRSWSGEWMSQGGYGFFIDDLAAILNIDFIEAAHIVKILNRQEKAGLNGFIIVPWEEEEAAYSSWEKSTGHKRLLVSDFSGWHCNHCGNEADEYGPSAKDVPCVIRENEEE